MAVDSTQTSVGACTMKLINEDGVTMPARSSSLMSSFYKLASLDATERVTTVLDMLGLLLSNENKESSLTYTVERLVKGLGSSRKAARQGFATALVHVLVQHPEIKAETVLQLVKDHLAIKGGFKSQEERDAYFGQVFGYLVMCKSRLFKSDSLDSSLLKLLAENIISLMQKKSYLREICCKALYDMVDEVGYTACETILKLFHPQLLKGWSSASPEDLYIVLLAQKKFKEQLPKEYLPKVWGKNLFKEKRISHLSRVLQESTNTAHPRVHVVWDLVLDHVLSRGNDCLSLFWVNIVEGGLLQSTHERKYLALNLLLKLLPVISAEQVPMIFSKGVLRCIFNSCQSKENYLFNMVKEVLKKLPLHVSMNKDPFVTVAVIRNIVGKDGNVNFDAITRTKTVEKLVGQISLNDIADFLNWLEQVFFSGTLDNECQGENEEESKTPDSEQIVAKACRLNREWALSQLLVVLKTYKAASDDASILRIAKFLFTHTYFEVIKKSKRIGAIRSVLKTHLEESSLKLCRTKLTTVLTELASVRQNIEGSLKPALGGLAKDGEFFAAKLLSYGEELLKMPKYVSLRESWTPEIYEALASTTKLLKDIKAEILNKPEARAFELLFVHSALHLFSSSQEAVEVLLELQVCYKKAQEKKKKKKKEESEPHWTEVLMEILLGYLTQPSHLMRQVVDHVFSIILPQLTENAFTQLINTIRPKEKGGEDNLEVEPDEDDDLMEAPTKTKLHSQSDVDEAALNGHEETTESEELVDDSDDDNDDEDDSDEDKDEESDIEVDEALKMDVKAALGDAAAVEEGSENDDDDLDMDAVDPKFLHNMDHALAAAFKSHVQSKQGKKRKQEIKQTIIHFKLRVMDLVEIFIRKEPKNPLILLLISPLLELLKSSGSGKDEQVLAARAQVILKSQLCQLHEYPAGQDLNVTAVHSQLEGLFSLSKTMSSLQLGNFVTHAIMYLVRVLRGTPLAKEPSPLKTRSQKKKRKEQVDMVEEVVSDQQNGCLDEGKLVALYSDALVDFMTKRSSLIQPALFLELINRFPDIAWRLASSLPAYLHTACNNFRKMQACKMLENLLRRKTSSHADRLEQLQAGLVDGLSKALDAASSEACTLKARNVNDLVQLCSCFVKEVSKLENVWSNLDKQRLKASLSAAASGSVAKRSVQLQKHAAKVTSLLDGREDLEPRKKKRKNAEESGKED